MEDIEAIHVYEIDLTTTGENLWRLYESNKEDLPDDTLFDYIRMEDYTGNQEVKIIFLAWNGLYSGRTFWRFNNIIKTFKGTAKFSVLKENGHENCYVLVDGCLYLAESS